MADEPLPLLPAADERPPLRPAADERPPLRPAAVERLPPRCVPVRLDAGATRRRICARLAAPRPTGGICARPAAAPHRGLPPSGLPRGGYAGSHELAAPARVCLGRGGNLGRCPSSIYV
jgi:hypothetical protein